MRISPRLRLRFVIACTGLVLVISTLSAIAVYRSQEYMEDRLLLELMQREVDEYARLYQQDPNHVPPRSTELTSYIVGPGQSGELPPELRGLGPGIWHDVPVGDRAYQVANFTLQDKRFYLTYDITGVEQREHALRWVLIAGVLLATGLAAALAWRLSEVVVAPVARLAAQIKEHEPGSPDARLAERFPDADLRAIAAAFDAYARRLADFIVRERAFTEDVSHELRTPISVVATAAERLEGDATLPAGLRPAVERIARAGREMQQTTQTLLYMAREAEPPEEVSRLAPLRRVLDDVISAHERLLREKSFHLATAFGEAGPQVPQGLASVVIGNLLSNAIQHSDAGAAELVQDGARVTVRDRGRGIPPEDLPHIFERHYRGSRSGGLGLGLHIVKRICERQDWALEVRSTPGETALSVRFSAS